MVSHSTLKQIFCLTSVFCLSLLQGSRNGWLASTIAISLKTGSPPPADAKNLAWIATTEQLTQILFVVLFSFFVTKAARKKILLTSHLIMVVGWWLLYVSGSSFKMIIASQFIMSMGLALFEMIAFTYISELTSPRNRIILSTVALLFVSAGTEMQFALQLFNNYELCSLVPLTVAVLSLIISPYFIVESPYHLIMNGGHEEAMSILSNLYVDESSTHVMMLYEDLQRYADAENTDEISYSQFFSTILNVKTFVFICSVYSFTYVNAHFAFLTFGPILMEPYTRELSVDFVMNVIGGLTVVCAILAPFIVDTTSRYFLLATGFGSAALLQCALAVLFYVESFGSAKVTLVPTFIVTAVLMLVMLQNLAILPAVQILHGEVFPHTLKIRGNCIMIVLKEIALILSRGLFFPMAMTAGFGFTFLFYTMVAFAGFRYVCHYYKDTKDERLTEIRQQYGT